MKLEMNGLITGVHVAPLSPQRYSFYVVCTLVCLMKPKDDESSQMRGEKGVDKCLSLSPDGTCRMVHMVIVACIKVNWKEETVSPPAIEMYLLEHFIRSDLITTLALQTAASLTAPSLRYFSKNKGWFTAAVGLDRACLIQEQGQRLQLRI